MEGTVDPSAKRADGAIADRLRELAAHDRLGNVSLTGFLKSLPGYHKDTWYKMVTGQRTLTPEAIEKLAEALDVPPEYFREYRAWQICKVLEDHPDEADPIYEVAMLIQKRKAVKEAHE